MNPTNEPYNPPSQPAGEPPEIPGVIAHTLGTVTYWFEDHGRGSGVIASDATAPWDILCPDIFILGHWPKRLTVGERVFVSYGRVEYGQFRYMTDQVQRLDGDTGESR